MIKGIGIDIIEIGRLQKAIERWGDDFLCRVFTPEEIERAKVFKVPYPHYAGRWAAKEAIFKALQQPDLSWQDIAIVNDPSGQPLCIDKNRKFKNRILISISHDRNYAVAQAVVEA